VAQQAFVQDDSGDCDVLVVGGSMVGLAAAMFLAQQAVRVCLVERHTSTSAHPKARGVSARTMELYRAAGIEGAIRAAGEDNFAFVIGDSLAGEYQQAMRPQAGPGDALSPTTGYSCDQNRIEPILRRRAAELGAQLFFGCTSLGIEQDESAVTAHVVWHPNGAGEAEPASPPSRITARYLVAADGAKGTIRTGLGIGRHGEPVPGTGLSVLFDADLDPALRGRRIGALIVPHAGALMFLRGKARNYNWFGLTPRVDLDSADPDTLSAEVIPMIRSVVGLSELEVTPQSVMTWTTGAYVADRYRAGRVFLAGDAAHLMPPYGGFGGNTGIADAHNLAWKLAAVCSGEAADALLDSYESERQPIAEYTVKHVMARGFGRSGEQRNHFDPDTVTLGFRYPSEAAPDYDPQNPLEYPTKPSGKPGTRAPHIRLSGAVSSTLDLLDPCAFTLLTPDTTCYASALRAQPVRGVALREVRRQHIFDEASWDRIFPDPATSALLIRPDGVIGWRSETTHPDPRRAVQDARAGGLYHNK
jgi:putative polyketide hydroxylase